MTKEVIICTQCDGEGTVERKELEDYHNNIYKYWNETCTKCKGAGRMLKTTKITIEPYVNAEVNQRQIRRYY